MVTVDAAPKKIEDVVVKLINCVRVLKITVFSTRVCVAKMVVGTLSIMVRFCKIGETSCAVIGICIALEQIR